MRTSTLSATGFPLFLKHAARRDINPAYETTLTNEVGPVEDAFRLVVGPELRVKDYESNGESSELEIRVRETRAEARDCSELALLANRRSENCWLTGGGRVGRMKNSGTQF